MYCYCLESYDLFCFVFFVFCSPPTLWITIYRRFQSDHSDNHTTVITVLAYGFERQLVAAEKITKKRQTKTSTVAHAPVSSSLIYSLIKFLQQFYFSRYVIFTFLYTIINHKSCDQIAYLLWHQNTMPVTT